MAVGKEIRGKIKSVENTRKITKALELVAGARLRRAQNRIEEMRPYADRMQELMIGTARAASSFRNLALLQQRDEVRRDRKLEAGVDDRGGDRVVAEAGAQRRNLALVVVPREAERVLRQRRMMKLGLGDVGHDTTLRSGVTFSASIWSPIARAMKRAVIGVPS